MPSSIMCRNSQILIFRYILKQNVNFSLFCIVLQNLLWHWNYLNNISCGFQVNMTLKVDMPILTCILFTFNWLTLTSEMHFVKFHPEVTSCLLSRGKRKYAPQGMRLLWKYIRNYFLVYHLISHFLLYLQNYKEFESEILDLQSEKYELSFDVKKYTISGWALGDENVIGIRAFKTVPDRPTSMQNRGSAKVNCGGGKDHSGVQGAALPGESALRAPWWGSGGSKAPWSWCFLVLKLWQKPLQSMYFLE